MHHQVILFAERNKWGLSEFLPLSVAFLLPLLWIHSLVRHKFDAQDSFLYNEGKYSVAPQPGSPVTVRVLNLQDSVLRVALQSLCLSATQGDLL